MDEDQNKTAFEARKKDLKKGVTLEEGRRRREEHQINIRKQKRNERLAKRRMASGRGTAPGVGAPDQPAHDVKWQPGGNNLGSNYNAISQDEMNELLTKIRSHDERLQLEATSRFRRLLSMEKDPPIQQVIDSGVVPRFVELLKNVSNTVLQFEAAWALTNVASGSSLHTRVVVECGAVPVFIELLRSPDQEVREQSVWALGNVAGDCPSFRDLVLQQNILPALLDCIRQSASRIAMMRNATWTLSNLCRGRPSPNFQLLKPALEVLSQILWCNDDEVLTDACWAFSYLSDGSNDKVQAVIESGAVRRLSELLTRGNIAVVTPALRTIGNIVTGDDIQTQTVINAGALQALLALLGCQNKAVRKEAAWTVSNITAGTTAQIQAVINANIVPALVNVLSHQEFEIRKEAAWAISNATSAGTREQIAYLVQHGAIPGFVDLLTVHDPKIVCVALEGIDNILRIGDQEAEIQHLQQNPYALKLEEHDGTSKIEELLTSDNEEVYTKAERILSEFFDADDDNEDESLVPEAGQNALNFGLNKNDGGDSMDFSNAQW